MTCRCADWESACRASGAAPLQLNTGGTACAPVRFPSARSHAPSYASYYHRNRPPLKPVLHESAATRMCFWMMRAAEAAHPRRAALVPMPLLVDSDPAARSRPARAETIKHAARTGRWPMTRKPAWPWHTRDRGRRRGHPGRIGPQPPQPAGCAEIDAFASRAAARSAAPWSICLGTDPVPPRRSLRFAGTVLDVRADVARDTASKCRRGALAVHVSPLGSCTPGTAFGLPCNCAQTIRAQSTAGYNP